MHAPLPISRELLGLLDRLLPSSPRHPTKEVSAMAWIQDPFGQVLFVRKARGRKLWGLPGGGVDPDESFLNGLRREVREELGLPIALAALLDVYDRPNRAAVTLLFRVQLRPGTIKLPPNELEAASFCAFLPTAATESARHFWKRRRLYFDTAAHAFDLPRPGKKGT